MQELATALFVAWLVVSLAHAADEKIEMSAQQQRMADCNA
jgi:hypothetical protein